MKFSEVRATGNNTSTVMISMDADAVPVKKEIAAVEKEIKKLENKQLPLINEFEQLRQKAAQAKQAIADADKALASGKIDKVDHFLITDEATKNIATYNTRIEELRGKIEGLDNQIMPLKTHLESLKFTGSPDNSLSEVGVQAKANLEQAANAAGKMSKELSTAKSKSDSLGKSVGKVDAQAGAAASGMKSKMTSSLKSVEGAFGNFGKRIGNTIKSAFVFSVIYKGLTELRQYLGAMLNTNQQFTTSLNQVKSNLAVAFQPIYQAALPAINALMNLLAKATAFLAAFTNALFGTSMSASVSAAREMQNTINAVENGAGGASAAERELTAAIKEKQKQVKALQKENKQLQREYEQQKKAVEAQTEVIEKQISSLEKSIDSIQKMEDAANKAAQAQREAIQKSIDLLEAQQEAIRKISEKQQKAIDSQIKALQKEQKQLQKQYDAQTDIFDDQIKSLQKQQKKLQKEYDAQSDAFDERIKNIRAQQDSLQDEYDKQTDGIDSQIKSLEKEKDTIQEAQKAAEKAKKANEKYTASFDELSSLDSPDADDPYELELERIDKEIDALEDKREALTETYDTQNEKLQEQIDLIQSQKDALAESYEAQSEAIQEQIEKIQEQKEAHSELYQSQREGIQEQIEALQEEKEAIAEKYDAQNEKIQQQIDLLQAQQDAIRDADFSAGIEVYESRIASLREKIDELNASVEENPLIEQNELAIEKLQEEIDLLQEQKDALTEVGTAASNINVLTDNLEKLKEQIEDNPLFQWVVDNKEAIAGLIGVLAVLATTFDGIFSKKGIIFTAVLVALAALMEYGGNSEEVINNLKESVKLFGEGLVALINGDFETFKKNFSEGFVKLGNSAISAFESIGNGLKKLLRYIIDKLIAWEEGLPEDSIWKDVFGFNVIKAENWGNIYGDDFSLERIPVPALAQGAVLPPNKPFMAWVGDQKQGTNVETPLSVIEDALRNVMSEQEYNFNISAEGSLGTLIRLLNLQINRENNRKTAF